MPVRQHGTDESASTVLSGRHLAGVEGDPEPQCSRTCLLRTLWTLGLVLITKFSSNQRALNILQTTLGHRTVSLLERFKFPTFTANVH